MKSQEVILVAVAETSVIVRSGLAAVLKRMEGLNVETVEVTSKEGLRHCMEAHEPDVLIVNPQFEGWFDVEAFKADFPRSATKVVSLLYTFVDASRLTGYDEGIDLFDTPDTLEKKIHTLLNYSDEEDGETSLSQREKEIIGCIVKGMTNKEIAEKLFISVHTVITHRRNITRKLQIHSAAGLTIYAIVNKLVELSDVKMQL